MTSLYSSNCARSIILCKIYSNFFSSVSEFDTDARANWRDNSSSFAKFMVSFSVDSKNVNAIIRNIIAITIQKPIWKFNWIFGNDTITCNLSAKITNFIYSLIAEYTEISIFDQLVLERLICSRFKEYRDVDNTQSSNNFESQQRFTQLCRITTTI